MTTSMRGLAFSNALVSASKNERSTLALFGGSLLSVMLVFPLAASSSPPEPHAAAVSATAAAMSMTRLRRNPVLLIGGPLRAGARKAHGGRAAVFWRRTLKHRRHPSARCRAESVII